MPGLGPSRPASSRPADGPRPLPFGPSFPVSRRWRSTFALDSRACVAGAPGSARPLFCANRDVEASDDAVSRLWQLATTLREHRGDGHAAALAAEGLSGCEPHLLLIAERGYPPSVLQDNRGWSPEEWGRSRDALVERGLISRAGDLSQAGRSLRDGIEATTDHLAATAYDPIGAAGADHLIEQLHRSAAVIARAGVIPYPNPIGLSPVR